MVSQKPLTGAKDRVLDPAVTREARDCFLALEYVKKGESSKAVTVLEDETGINRRTIYRAISKKIEWARAEWARILAEGDGLVSDKIRARSTADVSAAPQDCTPTEDLAEAA